MSELKFCRICLANNVRMHQISGSEVQDVYEKLSNKKVQKDGRLYLACYICYYQLKKCQQLAVKSQKVEELLQKISINSEMNLKSIALLNRLTYGLSNSLVVARVDSQPIQMEYNEITIKTEREDVADSYEVMIEYEPDDDSEIPEKIPKLEEKHTFIDKPDYIERGEKNIFGTQTKIASNEHNSSQIVRAEKFQQVFVKGAEKSFTCNDCGETCDKKSILLKHLTGHKPVTFKPNTTDVKSQDTILDLSFTECDLEKPFKCQYCDYNSVRKSDIRRHTRTHTGEKPFKCQYCDYTCAVNSNLQAHIRTHTGEKPFQCPYCSYTCSVYNHLKTHIRTHTGEKPFKCQYCDYTCTVNSSLKAHIRTHTGEKPYKCELCNYTSAKNSTLRAHMRTHTGVKPFKCQHCSYTSIKNYDLKAHMATHAEEKPFKCDHCSYTCTENEELQTHITTHTKVKPFKCQYCDYTCTHGINLKIHVKTHTGEKPYICQYCDYTCADYSNLKAHIRTHTGEKPLKCEYCDFTCKHNSNLKTHVRIHTGETPFKCQYCDYTCKQNGNLKRHIINTHTKKQSQDILHGAVGEKPAT